MGEKLIPLVERGELRLAHDGPLLTQAQPAGVGAGVVGGQPGQDLPFQAVISTFILELPNVTSQAGMIHRVEYQSKTSFPMQSMTYFPKFYQDVKLIVKHCFEFSGVKDHKETTKTTVTQFHVKILCSIKKTMFGNVFD